RRRGPRRKGLVLTLTFVITGPKDAPDLSGFTSGSIRVFVHHPLRRASPVQSAASPLNGSRSSQRQALLNLRRRLSCFSRRAKKATDLWHTFGYMEPPPKSWRLCVEPRPKFNG